MAKVIHRHGEIVWFDKHEGQREEPYYAVREGMDGQTEYNTSEGWYTKWEIQHDVSRCDVAILFTNECERVYVDGDVVPEEELEDWVGQQGWPVKQKELKEGQYSDTREGIDGQTEYNTSEGWYTELEIQNSVWEHGVTALFNSDGERLYIQDDYMSVDEFEEWISEQDSWNDWARDMERQDEDPDY